MNLKDPHLPCLLPLVLHWSSVCWATSDLRWASGLQSCCLCGREAVRSSCCRCKMQLKRSSSPQSGIFVSFHITNTLWILECPFVSLLRAASGFQAGSGCSFRQQDRCQDTQAGEEIISWGGSRVRMGHWAPITSSQSLWDSWQQQKNLE